MPPKSTFCFELSDQAAHDIFTLIGVIFALLVFLVLVPFVYKYSERLSSDKPKPTEPKTETKKDSTNPNNKRLI